MSSPGASQGKESPCFAGDPGLILGSGRSRRRNWQPSPVFLPGEFHEQNSWQAAVHRVTKSQTWLWLTLHTMSYRNKLIDTHTQRHPHTQHTPSPIYSSSDAKITKQSKTYISVCFPPFETFSSAGLKTLTKYIIKRVNEVLKWSSQEFLESIRVSQKSIGYH